MPRSISSWATRTGPWQGWARAPWLARSVIKGGVSDPSARSKSSVGTWLCVRRSRWPAADPSQATGRVKRRDSQIHRAPVLEVRIQSPPAASHANFLPHLAEP